MGVEAADFSHWVLRSTEAELCDCLEVPEKLGDSCRSKGVGQGSPHSSGGRCDEISRMGMWVEMEVVAWVEDTNEKKIKASVTGSLHGREVAVL